VTVGAFHSTKNSGFYNFPEFPVSNETEFPGISGEENNLGRNIHIFENFLPEISVPFDFPPGISGIFD